MQKKLWSLSALSAELEINRRSLTRKLDDLPPEEQKEVSGRQEKKWKLIEVIKHLYDPPMTQEGVIDYKEARRRKLLAEAELAEIQLAKEKKEAISIQIANQLWEAAITACRARLLAIPVEASSFLITETKESEIESYLEGVIHEGLNELANGTIPEEDRKPSNLSNRSHRHPKPKEELTKKSRKTQTTAKTKRQPVGRSVSKA